MKIKKIIKYAIVALLTIVLLLFAFKGVKWGDFIEGLSSCNYWWIACSLLCGFLSTLVRGLRWRVMLLPIAPKLTRYECYDAYSICYLANLALPRSGEIVRCGALARTKKVSFESLITNMVLERSWDLLISGLLVVAILFTPQFGSFILDNVANPIISRLSISSVAIFAILSTIVIIAIVLAIKNRDVYRQSFGAYKVWRYIDKGVDGMKSILKMEQKGRFIVYTVLIQLLYWLQMVCVIYALPFASQLTLYDALFLMVVGSVGWLVPVQGGFGAYHFLVSMTLVPIYGFTQQEGLIFATVSHETQIAQMLIFGLISLFSISFLWKRLAGRDRQY